MAGKPVLTAINILKKHLASFSEPSVTGFSRSNDPYLVLISCILSLRTKDKTTLEAAGRLFQVAYTPQQMVRLSPVGIRKLIYPVGFYRNKSRTILEISRKIISDFAGNVPDTPEGLLGLRGVGRKTANLVLGLGYGIPAICVDTHVHRISNRLGWVRTGQPAQTEEALKRILPQNQWIGINTLLVKFGQNICLPVSPYCSRCPVYKLCKRVGVKRSR